MYFYFCLPHGPPSPLVPTSVAHASLVKLLHAAGHAVSHHSLHHTLVENAGVVDKGNIIDPLVQIYVFVLSFLYVFTKCSYDCVVCVVFVTATRLKTLTTIVEFVESMSRVLQ